METCNCSKKRQIVAYSNDQPYCKKCNHWIVGEARDYDQPQIEINLPYGYEKIMSNKLFNTTTKEIHLITGNCENQVGKAIGKSVNGKIKYYK